MQNPATDFSGLFSLAHDENRGFSPADGAERATRAEIVEYIDAHDTTNPPSHPTTALAWDLQRTLGESEGRQMLLYASRKWDVTPLRARDVVRMFWDDDHEPEAWRDEYLLDVIRDWRIERDCLQRREEAEVQHFAPEFREYLKALDNYESEIEILKELDGPEHQAWQNAIKNWQAVNAAVRRDMGDRDAPTDEQRAKADAAFANVEATYRVFEACFPPRPLDPTRRAQPVTPLSAGTPMPATPMQPLTASFGPLPDHPDLTMPQAEALTKFWAHLPSGKMIYEGTREMWSPSSLDKHIPRIKNAMSTGPGTLATTWLSQHRAVQSLGWAPGEPMIIEDRVLTGDGWLRSIGDRTFNRYVPPDIQHIEGDVSKWLNHIQFIYPNEAPHIVQWLAHRVQHPGDKVNHCLDFIGAQGIGKDTILAPVIPAIGAQNFKQITAKIFYNSEWNDYLQSVILRINEVHDLGGESRYGFYDATKDVITNPPESHRINTKHMPQYAALNVTGVVMTSNHLDALYISNDDRRHFVCVSSRTKDDFPAGYFDSMHAWFANGGNEAVAHYLANLDLSGFNAKAPPAKTEGWHTVVTAGLAPESSDLADVIDAMGKPAAVTLQMIRARTPGDSHLRLSFDDAKLRRAIPKRLAECGYIAVANPEARDSGGRWRLPTGKATIYARQELGESERIAAARALCLTVTLPPVPS